MKKTIIFVAAMFLISAPTQAELLEYDWKSAVVSLDKLFGIFAKYAKKDYGIS